jgi:O-antigen ligase
MIESLIRVLFFTYGIFLLGYFFFPKAPEHYEFYYLAVLAPGVLILPRGLKLLKDSPLFWLVVLYAAYLFLASFWSDPFVFEEFLYQFRRMGYVLMFIVITALLAHDEPQRFDLLMRIGCVVAAIAAVAAIAMFYSHNPFPQGRLLGIARMQYPIRSACAFGLFAILALDYLRREPALWARIGYALIALILLAVVVLTQSRTGLVSLILAALALFLAEHPKKGLAITLIVVGLGALLWLTLPDLGAILARGLPFRPAIWSQAFEHAMEAPIIGHGSLSDPSVLLADTTPAMTFDHAHNPALASLRDGGLIGLALFLAFIGYAAVAAFRSSRLSGDPRYMALFVYTMGCIVPNVDRIFTRPKEIWLYFWLPMIIIMGAELLRQDHAADQRPG